MLLISFSPYIKKKNSRKVELIFISILNFRVVSGKKLLYLVRIK